MRHISSLMASSLFAFIFVLANLCPSASAAFKYLREGMKAPEIQGADIATGEAISTDAWLKDNVVVVIFWATWSERSIDELRDLKEVVSNHPELTLKIVAVNVDGQTLSTVERESISTVAQSLELPFPVIIDDGLEQFYRYGVIAIPSTAVVDIEGVLRYGPSGYSLTTHDKIIDSIEVILGLRAPSADSVVIPGYQPTKQAGRYCNLALNQINREQYRRALQNLRKAQKSDSGFAQPLVLMGEAYIALDSLASALESFRQAVHLDSGAVTAWTGLGVTHLLGGQYDSAFSNLARASAIDNTYTPAVLSLGLCLAERGDVAAALDSVAQALDLNPRDPKVHYYLGQLHKKAGDTRLAVSSYQKALELLYPIE